MPFVKVERAGSSTVPTLVRAPGRVQFRGDAVSEVGAPVDGRITAVHVRVGQRVAAGAPLVTLSSPSAASVRAELAEARVMVQAAEAEVTRQEEMAAAGVGVASQRLAAEAELGRARAILAGLQSSSSSIGRGSSASVILRAPIAGSILERSATVGMAATAGGNPLVVVGESTAVWVEVGVFERDLPLIREGGSAHVTISSVPSELRAHVESVGGAVDPETHRAPVYLVLDEPPVGAIRSGMYARSTIEAAQHGIGIPTSAVLMKEDGRTVVYVAQGNRTFRARDVRVGAAVEGRVPVFDGLTSADSIVVDGALLLDSTAGLLR